MNIGILACGKIAASMSKTIRMMEANGEKVHLYAAASRSIEKAKEFAEREGADRAYGSYEDMLKDPMVDLVYIATPHSHHAECMRMCVEAGKAVLCEKSFTINARQAKEVLEYAEKKNVLVTQAIWTRYMPSRKIIQDIIQSGEIGEPKMLTANLGYSIMHRQRIVDPKLAGGALLDVGVYPINFASMFFGNEIDHMESIVKWMESGCDEQENITIFYKDGRTAHLMATTNCRTDRHCMIAGTKGYLTVDNVNNPAVITVVPDPLDASSTRVIHVPEQLTGYEYQVRSCMKALEEGKIECPEMPHRETITIMEQMDALRAQWNLVYPCE